MDKYNTWRGGSWFCFWDVVQSFYCGKNFPTVRGDDRGFRVRRSNG